MARGPPPGAQARLFPVRQNSPSSTRGLSSPNMMGIGSSLAARREMLPAPEVLTRFGPVQGRRMKFKELRVCDYFLGIPYAKPPVGSLRFQRPQPPEPWTRILPCRSYKHRSIQIVQPWEPLVQPSVSEDCLYLNVFTPALEEGKKYPVLFYIHGGGLLMDSPTRMPPEGLCRQFCARDVVVVTIAYRLGFLGFFTTGDAACPGNMGYLDMVEALKWTKENIAAFGGDPDNITVGGQSAGGKAADLLSLSPLSRDLFRRKIVMGGSSFVFWSTSRVAESAQFCREKAAELGWQPADSYSTELDRSRAMLDFLRTMPAKKFATSMFNFKPMFRHNKMPLAAVVDGYFLPKSVDRLRDEVPAMPSICGVGECEGLIFIAMGNMTNAKKSLTRVLHEQFKDHSIVKEIVDTYARDGLPTKLNKLFPVFFGDVASNFALNYYMEYQIKRGAQCYAYVWQFVLRRRYGIITLRMPFITGTHSAELPYLLAHDYFYSNMAFAKKEVQMCEISADYFAAFVRNGDPNSHGVAARPAWPTISDDASMPMLWFKLSPEAKPARTLFGTRREACMPFLANMWNDDDIKDDDDDDDATLDENMNSLTSQQTDVADVVKQRESVATSRPASAAVRSSSRSASPSHEFPKVD